MTSTDEKMLLLDAMGITQWVSRVPAARHAVSMAENSATELIQPVGAAKIIKTGNAASGWLWLTETAVAEEEAQLLADIQQAVGCHDGGMLAHLDTASAETLGSVIESELITRLVIFASSNFADMLEVEIGQLSIAKVETLALTELDKSPVAKRQLWSDLKALLMH